MNAKHEYEFLANFKVLQNFFKTKKIDKARLLLARSSRFKLLTHRYSAARPSGEARKMQDAVRATESSFCKLVLMISPNQGTISNFYNG